MRAADISPMLDSCSLWARVDRHNLYPAGMSQDIGLLDVFRGPFHAMKKIYTHIYISITIPNVLKVGHLEIGSTSSISLRISLFRWDKGLAPPPLLNIIHRRIENWSFKYFCWVAPFPLHFQTYE